MVVAYSGLLGTFYYRLRLHPRTKEQRNYGFLQKHDSTGN